MSDSITEHVRRHVQAALNEDALAREELERRHGKVWNTQELRKEFEAIGFCAPLIVVRRRSDGTEGSLFFQHDPRFYWGWKEDRI